MKQRRRLSFLPGGGGVVAWKARAAAPPTSRVMLDRAARGTEATRTCRG